MPQEDINKIMYKLGEMDATMKVEFKGVHERMDKANGKLQRHDDYINQEIGSDKVREKTAKTAGLKSGGIVASVISGITAIILVILGGGN